MRRWQWFLHHDKALSHTLFVLQQFLIEKNIHFIIQSLYMPDIAPNDFWLFPTLKIDLKGHILQPLDI
jgi:hypothetical protein